MTLVELLVVFAILSVMIKLLATALTSIGKGNALTMSGNQIVNLLNLARVNSMSRNVMTAVVLNTQPSSEGAYRTIALMERAAPDAGAIPSSADWKLVSKWEELHGGVVVSSTLALVSADGSMPPAPNPALPQLDYHAAMVDLSASRSVVFLPNGSLFSGTATKLRLIEGCAQSGSSVATDRANYFDVTILPATGRTKTDRP